MSNAEGDLGSKGIFPGSLVDAPSSSEPVVMPFLDCLTLAELSFLAVLADDFLRLGRDALGLGLGDGEEGELDIKYASKGVCFMVVGGFELDCFARRDMMVEY